ncbi:hypothetical protein IV203_001402 [Nitzschia inconspicua]|uniref:Uncharacterized protein n=1 Tax=Nitzschia inconspicua TaxID=303405 RepID=A0A9K3L9A4_9STRA|nr:hypothetical protein IV203_001402 [Nitzschia inconspicua]
MLTISCLRRSNKNCTDISIKLACLPFVALCAIQNQIRAMHTRRHNTTPYVPPAKRAGRGAAAASGTGSPSQTAAGKTSFLRPFGKENLTTRFETPREDGNVSAIPTNAFSSRIGINFNSKAELFASAPTPRGTQLQQMENQQQKKLHEDIYFLMAKVQQQDIEMGLLKERQERDAEDKKAMQRQIDNLQAEVEKVGKLRRSDRVAKNRNMTFGFRKK